MTLKELIDEQLIQSNDSIDLQIDDTEFYFTIHNLKKLYNYKELAHLEDYFPKCLLNGKVTMTLGCCDRLHVSRVYEVDSVNEQVEKMPIGKIKTALLKSEEPVEHITSEEILKGTTYGKK
jgi:hypothetical protein